MKPRHILTALLAAALLLLPLACRTTREATTPPPSGTDPTATGRYSVISFTGTVDGISVSGQIRMAKDSIIWGSVTKLIEVGRAMATPDSVWVRSTLLGINETGTFQQAQRRAKTSLTFGQLQDLIESDDAEQKLADLARRLGHTATVRITRRQQVDRTSFPFPKQPSR